MTRLTLMFSQIEHVDAAFLKQALLLVVGAAGAVAAVLGIQASRNKKRDVSIDPPLPNPIQVAQAPVWASETMCASRHSENRDRLAEIERTIAADRAQNEQVARSRSRGIYEKLEEFRKELQAANDKTRDEMQQANSEMRVAMAKGFQDVERAIGRIEGTLAKERQS